MTGLGTVSSDWLAINDYTLCSAVIYNKAYDGISNEPQYYIADKKFTYVKDCTNIKNWIKILALLGTGSTLTREIFKATGSDTYTLSQRAADVKYIARYLDCKVVTKTSTGIGTIGTAEADMISKYDTRFTANALSGRLTAAITCQTDSLEYVRDFNISGTTFTLDSGIANLAVNDRFELINAFDIIKQGTQQTVGLPVSAKGYVIKEINLGASPSKIIFSPYDTPGKVANSANERVIVYYNALSDYQPQLIYDDSINHYDIYAVTEDLSNIPLTSAQIDLLTAEYQKYIVPLETITLVTFRPTVPEIGWQIPVNVTNVCTGLFNIIDVSYKWIHPYGQVACKPFQEITVILANYQNKLGKILAGLKRQNELSKVQVAALLKYNDISPIQVFVEWIDTPHVTGPENLILTAFSLPTASIAWDFLSGAESYRIYGSKYADFSILRHGSGSVTTYTASVDSTTHTYSDTNLLAGNTYYYKITAIIAGEETDCSNTVNTSQSVEPLYNWDTKLNITGTSTADSSGNGNDGVVYGNSTVASGVYTGGTTGYMSVPDAAAFEDTEKITLAIRFKLTTSGINTYLVIKSKSGFTSSYAYQIQCLADYVYINLYKGFAVLQLQLQLDDILLMDTWYKLGLTIDTTVPTVLISLNGSAPAYTETSGTIAGLLAMNSGQAYDITVGGWESDPTNYDLAGQIDWFYKGHGADILNQSQLNTLTT